MGNKSNGILDGINVESKKKPPQKAAVASPRFRLRLFEGVVGVSTCN